MNELKPEYVKMALECCSHYNADLCRECPIQERCFNEPNLLEREALALLREKDALIELLQDDLFRAKNLYLDLLGESKEKDAEIERLKADNDMLSDQIVARDEISKTIRSEAITDFAEKFENSFDEIECFYFEEEHENFVSANKVLYFIDQIEKEMKGE